MFLKMWKEANLAYPRIENEEGAFNFISSFFHLNYEVKFVVRTALARMEAEKKLNLGMVGLYRASAQKILPMWNEEGEFTNLFPRLGFGFCPDKALIWLSLSLSQLRPTGQTIWVITQPIKTCDFHKGNFIAGFSLKRNRQIVLSRLESPFLSIAHEDELVFAASPGLPRDQEQTLS